MGHVVQLLDRLYAVAGDKLTYPWDASAYLIVGDEPVLIDYGSVKGYEALKDNLASLGVRPKDIAKVIATHGHWDHLSGMAKLREESDAELWIRSADQESVETGDPERTAAFLYDVPFPPVRVDGELQDGDVPEINGYGFHVTHTPGHTPGSVSFWTDIGGTRLLIAGDTLWGGFHPRVRSDLEAWRASLDRLLEWEFDVMTFGHLPPTLVYDARTKVMEARAQLGVYFNPRFKPFYISFRY